MRVFRPTQRDVSDFGSSFAIAPVALVGGGLVSLATIPPAGAIGRHPAVSEQLFCVVAGSGWVSGGDGAPSSIVAGQAAWWEAGETHGVETEGGLTALIVQGAFTLPS